MYIFNGFFMAMRGKFSKPGTSIHYYVVEWKFAALSGADFRGKGLGPTDPSKPKDPLRGEILDGWKELGLEAEPKVGDSGMHASASPYEDWQRGPLGSMCLSKRIGLARNWCQRRFP